MSWQIGVYCTPMKFSRRSACWGASQPTVGGCNQPTGANSQQQGEASQGRGRDAQRGNIPPCAAGPPKIRKSVNSRVFSQFFEVYIIFTFLISNDFQTMRAVPCMRLMGHDLACPPHTPRHQPLRWCEVPQGGCPRWGREAPGGDALTRREVPQVGT